MAFGDESFREMVGETGFEPATPWTQTKCATKLRYSPIFSQIMLNFCYNTHVLLHSNLFTNLSLKSFKLTSFGTK